MILTGKEIRDLAEYAGFNVDVGACKEEIEEYFETEYTILECPDEGVYYENTEQFCKSKYIVRCDGCELNEASPIGDVEEIPKGEG